MRRGFTLLEMSIVLAVIGLLIGGVITGQTLIKAAQLRSVTTQYTNFMTAVGAFHDKYSALPGDFMHATDFWGTAAAGSACFSTVGSGTATCNGNGDQSINQSTNSNEGFRFWQQLANAGLIEGNFDGVAHGAFVYSATAANSPSGKIPATIWWVWSGWGAHVTGDPSLFDGNYNSIMEFGKVATGEPSAVFKPEDVWNMDSKMDDGLPGQGMMMTRDWQKCSTAGSSSQFDAQYKTTVTQAVCTPLFHPDFIP